MAKVESNDYEKFIRENKPRTKKEKIRVATAGFYAAGYGIKEAKKRAIARTKTKIKRQSRSRR